MNFYSRALELREETVAHRRYFHQHAEVGMDLPQAVAYITEQLTALGIEAVPCGRGVAAQIGQGGKTILLRADMDALPMQEESGQSFACTTGAAHTCGHDFHAAMLLTAAKLLKEQEASLPGTVKLMFQPGEEVFQGSLEMLEHGILENPAVDAALAFHVSPGKFPVGIFMYNSTGTMMNSVDGFRITVTGKGAHGAYPQDSVDPIHIAVQIYQALEGLMAREVNPQKVCTLTVGHFAAGTAANIIPDTAMLEGTIRTNDPEQRQLLVRRLHELSAGIAAAHGAKAEVTALSQVAPLICDHDLTEEVVQDMMAMGIPGLTPYPGICAGASEDFANIAARVPSAFIYLSAGYTDERGTYPAHNPKAQFNEDVCPIGSACLAYCAWQWLERRKKG